MERNQESQGPGNAFVVLEPWVMNATWGICQQEKEPPHPHYAL
jgi:hypothetical protein